MTQPLSAWGRIRNGEMQVPGAKPENLVWAAVLDERYQVEVQHVDAREGVLVAFDHHHYNTVVHEETVVLSISAMDGQPTDNDIAVWRQRMETVIPA